MAYASINATDSLAVFKATLTGLGVITSTLYEDADCLIFSSSAFAGVCKIKTNTSGASPVPYIIYYGASWTSAETLVGEIQVTKSDTVGAGLGGICFIASTLFAISWMTNSGTTVSVAIIGKTVAGDTYFYGTDTDATTNGNGYKNITDNAVGSVVNAYPYTQKTPAGNYYMMDCIPIVGGVVSTDNPQNLKVLLRDHSVMIPEIAGNDVVFSGGSAQSNSSFMKNCIIIVDGAV